MQWKSPPECELCQSKLSGTAEINSSIEADSVVLIVKESLLIDWALCPVCRSIVCKEGCLDRRSGYCRACARDEETKSFNFTERAVVSESGDDILSADVIF